MGVIYSMVGGTYNGARAWSSEGTTDHDLMQSMKTEEPERGLGLHVYCRETTFLMSTCEPSSGQREPFIFLLSPPERWGDVRVPVHEAIHRRGHLPASPWLLPAPPEQLLRLLGAVLAPGRVGTGTQPVGHLQRGVPADEQQLPSSAQVP